MAVKLTPSQRQFARELAAQTGLNPKVIAAWAIAEMGGANSGAAQRRERERNYNWLNIGYFDSGPGVITKDKAFKTPQAAAAATAEFLKGNKFGAAQGIRDILKTAGSDPLQQLKAIYTSPWASGHYHGGSSLLSAFRSVENPGGGASPGAQPVAAAVPAGPSISPDKRSAVLQQYLLTRDQPNALLTAALALKASGADVTPQAATAKPATRTIAPADGGRGPIKITGPNPGRINKPTRDFMAAVAGVFGDTIVGSDGTGHSKYTTSGNISDHYGGNASDIPAKGERLTRLGQAALIAAGMNPAQARKTKGGLFNLTHNGRRVQVIFNTTQGGNHWDHLHVGVK